MNIIIKNVTGHPENDGLIRELAHAGFPEGTKVWDVTYSDANKSCNWTGGEYHCIAWLGETCEELP